MGDQESGIDLGFDVTEYLRGSLDMDDFFITAPSDSLGPLTTQEMTQEPLLPSAQMQTMTSVAVPPSTLSLASLTSSLAAMDSPTAVSSAPANFDSHQDNSQDLDSFYQLKSTPVVGG